MDEAYSLSIVTRSFEPQLDQAMVYATWRNGRYYGSRDRQHTNTKDEFRRLTKEIHEILHKATVRVACLEESPEVIIGYVVYTHNHLDWIYVKEDYRRQGIASLILPKQITTITAYPTKLGANLWAKKMKEKKNGSEEARGTQLPDSDGIY